MQLGLDKSHEKVKHVAQGRLVVGIKVTTSDRARQNMLQTAQKDIEHANLEHIDSVIPAQDGQRYPDGTASGSDDVLRSLGTILDKIQVIVDATVNAVDVIAKVCYLS